MLSVSLGPMVLSLQNALLFFAFFVALIVGAIIGRKEGIPVAGTLSDIFLAALVTARVGFVIRYFEHYQESLWRVIDIRDGGFDVVAGLVGVLTILGWKLWRHPAIRKPLGSAAAAGLLVWGGVLSVINLIESQSRVVPEVPLAYLDERPASLAEVAGGQPMVVNLWASWCPPCVREMPVLEKAQRENPDITFVFVNQGEQAGTIRRFLGQHDLSLDNVLTDVQGGMGKITGSQALPTTLFYDAQGRQVDAHLGELSSASLAHRLKRFNEN
ncbi:TlpA family protein disulfide reductase [Marinobacter daepoensis]|uniref:TlpA family protein disulfide reductase n=1 Tax=Marinobacter daepoensis TaxID=262077 RepID=A0ABS3BJ34_9GAMM|nr:TlpA disulfide reductase family protein [Marinobacter daepoensis]MBN7770742.1 TlpA family protein disulfide reductase [Marinobacter daepoensis]MBY6078603.1 TlpA family protein disulfide reductase [Marinobacter daepoensis]